MSNKFCFYQITYFEQDQLIGVSFKYNQILSKRLEKFGFYYDSSKKSHVIKNSPFAFFIIEKYADSKSKRTKGYLAERAKITPQLEIYKLKQLNKIEKHNYSFNTLKLTPREHQIVALRFIELSKGKCLLNDEQGVGKSLEAIMYALQTDRRTLVLCPKNLVFHWREELSKMVLGSKKELFHVESYDYMSSQKEKVLTKGEFENIIIDEVHHLSNVSSPRFLATNRLAKKCQSIILLTGKKIESAPLDFYGAVKLLGFEQTKKSYTKEFFNTSFENKRITIESCKIDILKGYFSSFTLRRYLKDILPGVEKQVNLHKVETEKGFIDIYSKMSKDCSFLLNGNDVITLNQILSLSKIESTVKLVKQIISENNESKIIIATQFEDHVIKLNALIKNSHVFNPEQDNSSFSVNIVDSSKYREGIDLSFSNTIVFLDQFADETKNTQLRRRIDRLGQKSKIIKAYIVETSYLDEYLRKMPKNINYNQSLSLIGKYLNQRKAA